MYRRYRKFRELHKTMRKNYYEVLLIKLLLQFSYAIQAFFNRVTETFLRFFGVENLEMSLEAFEYFHRES